MSSGITRDVFDVVVVTAAIANGGCYVWGPRGSAVFGRPLEIDFWYAGLLSLVVWKPSRICHKS